MDEINDKLVIKLSVWKKIEIGDLITLGNAG